ncbi:hypothetical protein PR202_ga31324 [Eleusine coracana subsp. coracana]|uniref:Uncharacterized protein n=1 Tax=Eleusine coracana subsp. coracana TaxID=191504 RepID=A0AAV5DR31_ELECO|nr:hypothetical protein PR202_ga31324 [Eleusine coracana subsp. coracana]
MRPEIAPVTELIGRCTNLEFLHLSLRPAMACYSSQFTSVLCSLPRLRHLELKGCLHNEHTIGSVSVLLQNTSNLQVLSLFPLLPAPTEKNKVFYEFEDNGDSKEAIS